MDEFVQIDIFSWDFYLAKNLKKQEKYEKEIKDKSYKIDYNHQINETAWKC